jgi:hypothetical protein
MGSGGIAPSLLNFALDKSEWSASCPGRFTHYEKAHLLPCTHLNGRVGGPQSRQGRCGEQKRVCSCEESNTDSSVVQIVR